MIVYEFLIFLELCSISSYAVNQLIAYIFFGCC